MLCRICVTLSYITPTDNKVDQSLHPGIFAWRNKLGKLSFLLGNLYKVIGWDFLSQLFTYEHGSTWMWMCIYVHSHDNVWADFKAFQFYMKGKVCFITKSKHCIVRSRFHICARSCHRTNAFWVSYVKGIYLDILHVPLG